MSKISTLLDEAHTAIAALLPSHVRLPNPYSPPENPSVWLDQGYGVAVKEATNTNRMLSCQGSTQRTLTILLTRKYFGNDSDASRKYTTEKDLLEDLFLVVKSFEKRSPFQTYSIKSAYVGDSGIQFLYGADQKPFYMIEASFIIEYFENLNA